MARRGGGVLIPALASPDTASGWPLYLQLYHRIRQGILAGALRPGERMPSSRTLMADVGMSRNTVEAALALLVAEGFLVRRVGSGTHIADLRPDMPRRPHGRTRGAVAAARMPPPPTHRPQLSRRGVATVAAGIGVEQASGRAFVPTEPIAEDFPFAMWSRLVSRRMRRAATMLLMHGEPAGYRPLREAIAAYLGTARGVRCAWQQVIVLSSTQQALDLVTRLVLDPGDAAWIEDPHYLGARSALQNAQARMVPVPVDSDGIVVSEGESLAPTARLAYVTPSHQYPLGHTLSLTRRLALLAWAERAGAWVVEDDYDSEFRYVGRPLTAMQGIDSGHRVLYAGTFNKALFPSLRVAYLVLPEPLIESFVPARVLMDGHPPLFQQAVLTDFVAEGHLARHVRQMRSRYRERRDALLDAAQRHLGGLLEMGPLDAGLHVVGFLPDGVSDDAVAKRAAARRLYTPPLSWYYAAGRGRPGLLLKFARADVPLVRRGIQDLAQVIARG